MGTSGSTRLAIGYRVLEGAGPVGRVRGHGPGPTRPIRQPKYNSFSSFLLFLSENNTPALMSLQSPHIEETFITVRALIEAINEHALKQDFTVVKH